VVESSRLGGLTSKVAPSRLTLARAAGLKWASRFRGFRVENLKHVGWQLFQPASYVNWCSHAQEIIPLPLADGRVTFVPVLGEAR
jgi:hypothetical protein